MIYPTATDCIRAVIHALDDKIKPALSGTAELSALATIGHTLRLVTARIDQEGDILLADIEALRGLLKDVSTYVSSENAALAAAIDAILARDVRPAGKYPTLTMLAEEAGALRQALVEAQEWLIKSDRRRGEAAHESMRTAIRAYVSRQLADEATLIERAFTGHGPRR